MLNESLTAIAASIGAVLRDRVETVAVAEGSAGGLISAAMLSVPGASAYYLGGSIIYTAAAHRAFLAGAIDPPPGMRGATEGFASYLAAATIAKLGSTWALAEAGAAGPPNPYGDPAGHCWLAIAGPRSVTKHVLTGIDDRGENMLAFASAALELFAETIGSA